MKLLKNILIQLLKNIKSDWKKLVRDAGFILDSVYLLYYKWHKINLNCGDKKKKDSKCFLSKYPVTVALNQEEIKKILKEQQKLNFL